MRTNREIAKLMKRVARNAKRRLKSHKKSLRPLRIGTRTPVPGTYRLLSLMPEILLDKGDILVLPPRESLRYVLIDSAY